MTTPIEHLRSFAHVDVLRRARTGMPEIIYAASKTTDQVIAIADHMLAANGRVLISRPTADMVERCLTTYADMTITRSTADRMLTVARVPIDHTQLGGVVGIIAAGTSDLPVADEAAMVCTELGCQVERVTDVGVAGLHRLFAPLARVWGFSSSLVIPRFCSCLIAKGLAALASNSHGVASIINPNRFWHFKIAIKRLNCVLIAVMKIKLARVGESISGAMRVFFDR
jgi:hypothetical protein